MHTVFDRDLKTVRPLSSPGSSAIFSNDISFHTIMGAISSSKPLLASCPWRSSKKDYLNSVETSPPIRETLTSMVNIEQGIFLKMFHGTCSGHVAVAVPEARLSSLYYGR